MNCPQGHELVDEDRYPEGFFCPMCDRYYEPTEVTFP